jgi:hypothetical protein
MQMRSSIDLRSSSKHDKAVEGSMNYSSTTARLALASVLVASSCKSPRSFDPEGLPHMKMLDALDGVYVRHPQLTKLTNYILEFQKATGDWPKTAAELERFISAKDVAAYTETLKTLGVSNLSFTAHGEKLIVSYVDSANVPVEIILSTTENPLHLLK